MEKESKERRIFQKLKFNIHRLNAEFPKKEFNIMTDRDTVISDLEALERQARQHNFLELEELASIAIGKRIFNLEKNKKKLESMKVTVIDSSRKKKKRKKYKKKFVCTKYARLTMRNSRKKSSRKVHSSSLHIEMGVGLYPRTLTKERINKFLKNPSTRW